MKRVLLIFSAALLQATAVTPLEGKPNIVIILADDLGYGDIQCLNPERGKIATPHLDTLAGQGMIFTEAHSTSAVCTPSRYSLLTGRYNWRSPLQSGIVPVYGSPLIDAGRLTIPGFLKQQGYSTACIGKWHLGWDWPKKDGKVDFTRPIANGPVTRGFEYYFGVDVPNYPPYCFIENDRLLGQPTGTLPKELIGNNMASVGGAALPGWKLENILPEITDKACQYIKDHAAGTKPFFLFLPLTSPHTPLAVSPEWKGKSKLGRYADWVMETDAMIGRILATLDQSAAAQNTLVFFSSDNGCAPYIGTEQLEKHGHYASADRRGYKADIYDGGHRVPLLVRWPGKIKPGSTSSEVVSLVDLMATCSEVVEAKYPVTAGEDSISLAPILFGKAAKPLHEALVFHSINGSFAIRKGPWKLELCASSGGWSDPKPGSAQVRELPAVQLYDLSKDVAERRNEQAEHPEIVEALTGLLEKYVSEGRSTPGPALKNDVTVKLRKPADQGTDSKNKNKTGGKREETKDTVPGDS